MARSRSRGPSPETSTPPITIDPALGFSSPAIIRSAVLLPHPDGPTSTSTSPLATVSDRSSTATVPAPNSLRTWISSTSLLIGEHRESVGGPTRRSLG